MSTSVMVFGVELGTIEQLCETEVRQTYNRMTIAMTFRLQSKTRFKPKMDPKSD